MSTCDGQRGGTLRSVVLTQATAMQQAAIVLAQRAQSFEVHSASPEGLAQARTLTSAPGGPAKRTTLSSYTVIAMSTCVTEIRGFHSDACAIMSHAVQAAGCGEGALRGLMSVPALGCEQTILYMPLQLYMSLQEHVAPCFACWGLAGAECWG
jgi:hypothetical protein